MGLALQGIGGGRASAGVARLVLALYRTDEHFWQLLFADDIRTQAHGPNTPLLLIMNVLAWAMVGTPISWKKLRGGVEFEWLGYWLDYVRFELGLSEARTAWLLKWGDRILADRVVLVHIMAEGLGRLGFATGMLEWARPFLAPMYAWTASAPSGAILSVPPLILLTLTWILDQLKTGGRTTPCRGKDVELGEIFRTDAKGDEKKVVLGGWETQGNDPPDPRKSRWFSVTLTEREAPWLFARGHASRTISSGELLGTLVAVHLFCTKPLQTGRRHANFKVTGQTDNQGNSFVVSKLHTTKFPLCAVLMQLATTLGQLGLWLDLNWQARELNTEADALTNDDYGSFDMALRIPVVWSEMPCEVLERMVTAGESFLADILKVREAKKAEGTDRHNRYKKKRVKEVWG